MGDKGGRALPRICLAMRPDRVDYLLLLLLGAMWGASFLLIKLCIATIPPLSVAAGRLVIGTAVLAAFVLWRGDRIPRGAAAWGKIVVMGVIGTALPFFLINWGELHISSGLTAILMSAVPLSTLLMAHIFQHDEPLTGGKVAGVLLGGMGVVVLVGPSVLGGLGEQLLGQLGVLGATLCYAANGIMARRLIGYSAEMLAMTILLIAAFICIPAALVIDRPWTIDVSAGSLWALLALGILPTAGGYLLLFRIVARAGAGFSSFVNFLVPPLGVFWGALLLDEALQPQALLGLAIVLAGLAAPRLWPGRATRPAR